MSINANCPAEIHNKISNEWLTRNAASKTAAVDCRILDGNEQTGRTMRPRGVLFSQDSSGGTTTATIHGHLWGENVSDDDHYTLVCNVVHSIAFKKIYARGTTARNLMILG